MTVCSAAVRVQPLAGNVGKTFDRLEWRIELGRSFNNPFDPDEVAVDCEFHGPADQMLKMPAFWMRQADGTDGGFHVRFAPPAAGGWTLRAVSNVRGDVSTSDEIHFSVQPGESRGFVRRVDQNPAYFRYDSGEPYFLIGPNIAWGVHKELASYEPMLAKLAASGGNFARIWMCDPSYMTESREVGLGRYDQAACANYDTLLAAAQRHGIACMVTFNNYRDLREKDNWGPCPWKSLPYASENGGPCTHPADFIARTDCQKLYRQRLRYIVARYAAFTSVAFWEFFNEQSFAEVPIPPEWTIGMATYLHAVDPYQHLVSTSFGNDEQPAVWNSEQIALTQAHQYAGETTPDAVSAVVENVASHRGYNKPFFLAEVGISADHSDSKYDPAGNATNLHNSLWAAMMSGACGGAANWWWDDYIEAKNLWNAYQGFAAFSRQIDWTRRRFQPFEVPPSLTLEPPQPERYADSTLAAAGGWGKSHGQPVELLPNGQARRALPHYILGSRHAELQTPTRIDAEIPSGGSEMIVRVSRVSDAAVLRVSIDGEPTADFLISLLAPGEAATTRPTTTRSDSLQGPMTKEFSVRLPPGRHRVELSNVGSDWFYLDSVTLKQTRSSRYADLEILAMSDVGSGEILAWLHDTTANWRSAYDGHPWRVVPPAKVHIPASGTGVYIVQWWDTRAGKMISSQECSVQDGKLSLETPPIDRDVALRALRR